MLIIGITSFPTKYLEAKLCRAEKITKFSSFFQGFDYNSKIMKILCIPNYKKKEH